METCKTCSQPLPEAANYCSYCGKNHKLERINGRYILSEIGSVLNFNKGMLYTIREVLLRPGANIRTFIHEDRERLVKPMVFILVCSLIYTLFQQMIGFEDGYVNYDFGKESKATIMFTWISANYGYANILISVFVALWIKLFFRKRGYNFFEILILLCYTIGVGMLIFTLFGIVESLVPLPVIDKGFLIGILYISWGIGDFFTGRKFVNLIKGFFAYIFGLITFSIAVVIVGLIIDALTK